MNINDIARLAGTSKSTVSRVLTNHPNVKSETRKKVLQIIKQYQYHPNSIAQGLVTGSIKVIALVVSDIRNPYYSETTWYIEKELYKNGYNMFLFCSENDPDKERSFLEMASQFNFSGIVVVSPINEDYLTKCISSLGCPILILNRYIENFTGDVLTTDNFQAGYLAARHLIELGHTRIGILSGANKFSTHRDRREGFLNGLNAYHIQLLKENDFSTDDLCMECGNSFGEKLLSMGTKAPTAIFCTTDLLAIGVMQAYKKAGKSIPGDLSIIGFDNIPFAGLNDISLTTIAQPYKKIGDKAVEMLMTRINSNPSSQQKAILDCELIIRNSTGRCC